MKVMRPLLTASALAALGVSAAHPLLAGRLPWAADTLIHFYRLVELDHLLRQGYVFPRFAPDLAYGFGFPVFNFYAPLSYYVALLFRLAGLDIAPSLLAALCLFSLCAGLGMYAWAAEIWNPRAGLVAAAAYVTAPYFLYNIYHRGALAEVLAMALMPAVLWAVARLARTGSAWYVAWAALLYAALLLGHNITALVFTPIVALYAGLAVTQRPAPGPHGALRVALALALGFGLAAFFLIPAFVERDSVQVIQLFLPQMFDYHYNFVGLRELFSLPVTVDPNLLLPPTPRSIGLIPLALAVLALVFGWRRWSRVQKVTAGLLAALASASLFLMLPQSAMIWDALPILRYVQFPWRFLGLASLAVAFLAGGGWGDVTPGRADAPPVWGRVRRAWTSWWFAALLTGGMVVYGFAWQYVPSLDPPSDPTVADIAHYERESGALGTTSAGDFMPNSVKRLPDANALTERYARSNVVERLNLDSLPAGAQVIASAYRPLSFDVTLDSPAPLAATFDAFYFAGWQAQVDGQPVSITPTDPHGLISVPVPAGRHRVQVWFGSTPLRTAMSVVSLLSLAALVAFVIWRPAPADRPSVASTGPAAAGARLALCITVVTVSLLIFKAAYLDTRETIVRRTRFDGARVERLAHPLQVSFENQMALMGYEPATLSADMGGTLSATLYWRAMSRLGADYSVSAQLVDERGFVYGQRDSQHPGGYPTSRWKLSDYARDAHDIPLAAGTPPGEYRLRVSVYRVGAPSGLSILDAGGAPAGTQLDVAAVTVKRPAAWRLSRLAWPKVEHPSGATPAPGLVLSGYDFNQTQVNVGEKLYWTLYWQATRPQPAHLKARMQLVDPQGGLVYSTDVEPISPQFAVSRMAAGDVLRGPNAMRIPPSMPGGLTRLRLTLVNESGAVLGDPVDLGQVMVRVPDRNMTLPGVQYASRVDLGPVRFVGYDLPARQVAPGQTFTLTLTWQALSEMTADYKSFVHVLDASGRLVVGSDAVPAQWTRPTTGWLAGEYVADVHAPALPDGLGVGEYRLEVGLYDSASGQRLGAGIVLDQTITVARP